MGRKFQVLFLILMALIGLSSVYVVGGLQAYSRYQQSSLATQEHCGGQAPVRICVQTPVVIFSAFYRSYVDKQHTPLFTIQYSSSTPLTLFLSASIPGFSQSVTQTVNANAVIQSFRLTPPLVNDEVLRTLTVDERTSLHVQAVDTKRHLYYLVDSPLLLRSRLVMQWGAANRLKIAAWVTPYDPAITQLVHRAATYLPTEPLPTPTAMIGYNNGKATPRAVKDQVDAMYDALRLDYRVHYVQEGVPYGGLDDNNGAVQNIKLPFEVLQERSGMCVELTVLLASAVESIGLHAEIVIIPGHAFLGVALTPDNRQFEYWDAVHVNDNVASDSANLYTDDFYDTNLKQHTIVDTILIGEARVQGINPMVL